MPQSTSRQRGAIPEQGPAEPEPHIVVQGKIPLSLNKKLEYVLIDSRGTKAGFVADAVREKLERHTVSHRDHAA